MSQSYIYILANKTDSTLYVGVTNDLVRRIYEHKQKLIDGFTKMYRVDKLVYYEIFDDIRDAIMREKQLKGGSRAKKAELITKMNPNWKDLYRTLV